MACPHPGTFGGLCVACGADLSAALAPQTVTPEIKHHKTPLVHRAFQISSAEARNIQEDDTRELRQKRKLILVLDLDNTLIFAPSPTAFSRPYLNDFLESTSKNYKLVLYTQGDDLHATTSLQKIDPSGKYFSRRFIARKRGDDPEDKRLDYLHSAPAHIVIMDDRLDVWHEHLPNLLLVPPYEGLTSDIYLKLAIPFLRNLHSHFFRRLDNGEDADVRHILNSVFKRRSLLEGLGIVFSGVIPQEVDPSTHSFWAAAELYGAKCFHHLHDNGVTHLITASEGTVKVQKAAKMGLKIVRFDWLMEKWRWGMISPDEQPQEVDYDITASVHPHSETKGAPVVAAAPEAMREQAQMRQLKRAMADSLERRQKPRAKDPTAVAPAAFSPSTATATPVAPKSDPLKEVHQPTWAATAEAQEIVNKEFAADFDALEKDTQEKPPSSTPAASPVPESAQNGDSHASAQKQ